ncbi:phenylpyruvate tautomerase [Desulfosarcina alkanivorans]|uniref:L-dopachrome isomerase n=2 Tax=Desulfosarcina alkanivorans TaxID=571177 RepID=A0A5K7YMH8_9BACT|nr:phenylpyruvate tautomerase [Desulfosarcina alkanivorans]
MPYFSIRTSQTLEASAVTALTRKASAFAAELLGKPESYVMTSLQPGSAMTFAGSHEPAAFIEVRSIGLAEAHCSAFAEKISAFIHLQLGIDPNRVFIDFTDLPPSRFAWNGKTFA